MSRATDSLDISMTITFPDDTTRTVAATISADLLHNGAVEYVTDVGDRLVGALTREARKIDGKEPR